jgi:hypothetical protein
MCDVNEVKGQKLDRKDTADPKVSVNNRGDCQFGAKLRFFTRGRSGREEGKKHNQSGEMRYFGSLELPK